MKGGMVLAQEYLPTLPINQNGQRITSVKRDLFWKEYCTENQIIKIVEKHLQRFYSRVMVFLMMHHEYYYIISLEV